MDTSLNQKSGVIGIDKKIPFMEKFIFPSSTGFITLSNMMIQTWLLFFYTDIMKLNVAYVGAMFIVVTVLDALITPAFGAYIDKSTTRWGKYKPWFFIIWIGIAVFGLLTFINEPSFANISIRLMNLTIIDIKTSNIIISNNNTITCFILT